MEFFPYYDADIQLKVQSELGEDKLVVFNNETGRFYLAEKSGERYIIDVSTDHSWLSGMVHEMQEGTWQQRIS